MPPPLRPCGRTPAAVKWSSWASELMKQSSSSPVRSSTAPTTSSPSLSPITSHSSLPSTSGLTRFTTPCLVPSARPGPSLRSAAQRRGPARPAGASAPGRTAARPGGSGGSPTPAARAGRGRCRRTTRPREVRAPISPRAVVRTAETMTSWLARAPSPLGRLVGRRAGEQPGRREIGEARVVGDLERRSGGRDGDAGRLEQHGAARGAEGLGDLARARRRRPSAAAGRRPGSRRAPRSCARARPSPSPARAWRTSSAGAGACRGCSRPAPRSGRRPRSGAPWPRRRCRRSGSAG